MATPKRLGGGRPTKMAVTARQFRAIKMITIKNGQISAYDKNAEKICSANSLSIEGGRILRMFDKKAAYKVGEAYVKFR